MAESPVSPLEEIQRCCRLLQEHAELDPERTMDAQEQLEFENAIAAGVAALAQEPPPVPSSECPTRLMVVKDMLLTADLVRRSLESS